MRIPWDTLLTMGFALFVLVYALSSYRKRHLRNARVHGLLGTALMSSAIHSATQVQLFTWLSWITLGIAIILMVHYGMRSLWTEANRTE